MSVKFAQVQKSSGLDVAAKAMIVPVGGSKIIKVFGASGLSLFDDRGILEIKKLDTNEAIMDKLVGLALASGANPTGDSFAVQLKMAVDIGLQLVGQPQFFKITGKTLGGKKGTTVRVAKTQKSKAEESLQVVVLKPRRLSLSIRPVQVSNNKGGWVYHCERYYDAKALLARTNDVWTPQANIVFTLASSDPAPLDDQEAIAKALGSSSPNPMVPPIIEFDDFKGMFQKIREKEKSKADFTIFMVHRITHGGEGNPAYGVTNQKGAFALVADDGRAEDMETISHEIGHYLGTLTKGSLYGDNNSSEELLMCSGEANGTKVPFQDVITYFNTNYN
jgi:hypothetical protein